MPKTVEDTLLGLPLFRGLHAAEVKELAALCEPLERAPKSTLFREGEAGDALYLVLVGSLRVVKQDHAGHEKTLAQVKAPGVLGEMSLFAEDAPRSATARVEDASQLLRLDNQRLRALFAEGRPSALKLGLNLAGVLSRRLRQVDEKLVEVLGTERHEELAEFQNILSRWTF